jgi:hypothetical protein
MLHKWELNQIIKNFLVIPLNLQKQTFPKKVLMNLLASPTETLSMDASDGAPEIEIISEARE